MNQWVQVVLLAAVGPFDERPQEHGSSDHHEHGEREFERLDAGVPLLGKVPLEPAVSEGGDTGSPIALGEGPAADAFRAIAERIVTEAVPPTEMAGCSARMLEAAMAALDDMDAADSASTT